MYYEQLSSSLSPMWESEGGGERIGPLQTQASYKTDYLATIQNYTLHTYCPVELKIAENDAKPIYFIN